MLKQSLIPKRLTTRLVVMFSILISLVLAIYAWRSLQHETHLRLEASKAQSDALTYQISVSSKHFLITDDYAELENIIIAFAHYPGIQKVMILDDDNVPVVTAFNKQGQVAIDYSYLPQAIERTIQGTVVVGQELVSRRVLSLGQKHYLVYLVRDNSELAQLRRQALWRSLEWALPLILLSLMAIYLVIRNPMYQLQRASRFARGLIQQQDQQLLIKHGGEEVRELGRALTDAAHELSERQHRLQRQRLMLDIVRQLQSEYIASTNLQHLFDRLLQSLLLHTASDYGLIATRMDYDADLSIYAQRQGNTPTPAEQEQPQPLDFDRNTHVGQVMSTGKPLLLTAADLKAKPSGLAETPPLQDLLLMAIDYGAESVGVLVLGNRPGGYEPHWLEELQPLLRTCGQIIDAIRGHRLRTRMEGELKDSRQMLLTVLDTIPVRVFWKDMDGSYLGCNRHFATDAGYTSVSEIIGCNDFDMPWANKAEQHRFEDHAVIKSGHSLLNYEEQRETLEGEQRWLQVSKIPLTNYRGETIGVLGAYDDVTDRKQIQDQIKEREARLAEAQHIAHLGNWQTLYATAQQEERHLWSDEAFRIFGLEPNEMGPGFATFNSFIHPDDQEWVQQYRETMLARQEDFSYECRILRRDGAVRYLNVSTVIMHKGDKTIGIMGTMQDITERKQVEKLKDEFISTVSHELRTPLTSIRGSLGLVRGLSKEDDMPPRITNLLDIAHNNTERLLHLINDILDISKIESGELALDYHAIFLQDFLEQVINDNRHYMDEVELVLESSVGDLKIEVDPERMRQIMNNLVSNACKFSPKGERVELRAERDDNHVRISVSDHGPGIPPDYQSRIFDRFTQADGSNTRDTSGTGLGLSITKALVERHGGYISFDTHEGKGTTFYIVLPVLHQYNNQAEGV